MPHLFHRSGSHPNRRHGRRPTHRHGGQPDLHRPEDGATEPNPIKSALNGLFLSGAGVAVLLAKGLLFAGPIKHLVAATAAIWGGYILLTDRTRHNVGWVILAGAGVLALFGGLLQAGAGSFFVRMLRRRTT